MPRPALAACLCVFALSAIARALPAAEPLPWQTWNDFKQLARVGGHSASWLASSYCPDGCRYDRSSVDPGAGGRRFVRIDATADGDEAVLLDQPGAGAVTRLWMTTGNGQSAALPNAVRLRVYFDGSDAAAIDAPLADFFGDASVQANDRRAPPQTMVTPRDALALVSSRRVNSGGNVSYLPLPYARGIKIALLGGADLRLWYQIDYTRVTDATPVPAFAGEDGYADLGGVLAAPAVGDRAIARAFAFGRDARAADLALPGAATGTAAAGAPLVLFERSGAGWITALHIQVDPSHWDDLRMTMRFDGETTVDVPLARFFGADLAEQRAPLGVLAGVDARGAFYSQIPLPFRGDAEVALSLRDGAGAAPVTVRWTVAADDGTPPPDTGVFRVGAYAACPSDPARDHDNVLLRHSGSGRLVGLSLWMSGDGVRSGGYYLEGDERVHIDGSVQPLWYGTGVEDAFNGGFYFDAGAYVGALAGAPLRHPGARDDATSMYRWFLTDSLSWRNSLVYALENGAVGDEPLCIDALAYYFAQPAPAQVAVAHVDIGDAGSVSAARYVAGSDAVCSMQTAQFGDEPPTTMSAGVCRGTRASRFAFASPGAPARYFRLRRTFDAGVAGQAAEIYVNGTKVGAWGDVAANTARRWSQLDVDVELATPATELAFEIRPLAGREMTESRYELWADTGAADAYDTASASARFAGGRLLTSGVR